MLGIMRGINRNRFYLCSNHAYRLEEKAEVKRTDVRQNIKEKNLLYKDTTIEGSPKKKKQKERETNFYQIYSRNLTNIYSKLTVG